MKFKQWMTNEVQWLTLGDKHVIDGQSVDSIDFRFEDWRKALKDKGVTIPDIAKFMWNPFSAKLPSGQYLNFFVPERVEGHKKLVTNPNNIPIVTPKPMNRMMLPDYWYDLAVFYDNGQIVKNPSLRRDYE